MELIKEAEKDEKFASEQTEHLPPRGLAIEKEEANRDQLSELLKILQDNPT